MKRIILAVLMASTFLSCEKKTTETECGFQACTLEFIGVGIKFTDNEGVAAEVKDFSVMNQRTGEKVYASSGPSSNLIKGTYLIVDDGNRESLSEAGDDLKVTATSAETNQTKSVIVKVKGGKCSCHIAKVSGPELVTFD